MAADYINAFTRPTEIHGSDTALVVVDMQYASGSRRYGLGAHLAREGKLGEAEYRFNRIAKHWSFPRRRSSWKPGAAPTRPSFT